MRGNRMLDWLVAAVPCLHTDYEKYINLDQVRSGQALLQVFSLSSNCILSAD